MQDPAAMAIRPRPVRLLLVERRRRAPASVRASAAHTPVAAQEPLDAGATASPSRRTALIALEAEGRFGVANSSCSLTGERGGAIGLKKQKSGPRDQPPAVPNPHLVRRSCLLADAEGLLAKMEERCGHFIV